MGKEYLGTKVRIRRQEDPTPRLLSRSQARDCERPRLNHSRPALQDQAPAKGLGQLVPVRKTRRTSLHLEKTKGGVHQVHPPTLPQLRAGPPSGPLLTAFLMNPGVKPLPLTPTIPHPRAEVF